MLPPSRGPLVFMYSCTMYYMGALSHTSASEVPFTSPPARWIRGASSFREPIAHFNATRRRRSRRAASS